MLQLEIRDKFCPGLGGVHGRLDGWSSRGLANFKMPFPHIAGRVALKVCDLRKQRVHFVTTTAAAYAQMFWNMWKCGVILNLFLIFSIEKEIGHFCKSCHVKAKHQPIPSLTFKET